jgi:aminoglycoside phosphotransferase (APT) family kinase protein
VDTDIALPHDLVIWMEGLAGGPLVAAVRRPGGARKEAWFVDFEGPGSTVRELFLRFDRSDPSVTFDPWTLHREAVVYLALQDTDVLVPRVLGVHGIHQAMLSERLTGENWFSRITDPAEQVATAQHFMEQLAALHSLDPRELVLPGFPEPTTVPDMVRHELDEWDHIIEQRGGPVDPQLVFALDWLRRNIPSADVPVVLVQGDTGPGNFMYANGKVIAVVDWELAHFGDPMDDIAWLSLRATQEPFTDFPARLTEYTALTGNEIDERRVHYYQVMAETKLLVLGHRPRQPGQAIDRAGGDTEEGGGADIGNGLIYAMLHRRLWFEAIAAFVGLDLAPPAPLDRSAPRGDHAWLYDALLAQLRDVVVPRISDPLALQRSKGFARVIKYLRDIDERGATADEQELADLSELLGVTVTDLREGRTAISDAVRSGAMSDSDYLTYLWGRVARDNELMRSASGALADRHWPALT